MNKRNNWILGMKRFAFHALLFAGAIALINACTDPSAIGSTLLEEDTTRLEFFDTVSINAVTEDGQPIVTHSRFTVFEGYLSGCLEDPVFGKNTANLYFQVLPRVRDPFLGDSILIVDSIILVLPYNVQGFYGSQIETYGLDVFRVDESMPNDVDYFSDRTFQVQSGTTLGTASYRPTQDSISFVDYSNSNTDTLRRAQLRIPLDMDLATELLSYDSTTQNTDALFLDAFKGLNLVPTTVNTGMSSFDIGSREAGIFIYYRADSTALQYQLEVASSSTKFMNFVHDYDATVVGDFLADTGDQDSILFAQGMAGPVIKVSFPFLAQLRSQEIVVNKAELEIRIGTVDGDNPNLFPPSDQILIATKNADGDLEPISDFALGLSNLEGQFGGVLIDEPNDEPDAYRMNISTHFQEILDGREPNEFFLVVSPKAVRATRTIIYGANHPEFPIKLRVAGTVVN